MAALRELAAILGIEVEGEDQVKSAEKAVGGLIDQLKAVGRVVAEAFAWREAEQFVQHQVDFAVQLERTSQMLGLTTQQLELYQVTAKLAGLESETMTTGLRHLNYSIGEAVARGGEQAQVFAQLKIQLKDAHGQTRSTSDVMAELADKIAATDDPAKKTQIAMQLLGRYGAALIPVLNQGSAAFADARKEMDELGGATTTQYIEQAKKVQEAETRLDFAFERTKQVLALSLFPIFSALIDYGTRWAKTATEFAKQTTLLKTGLEALAVVASFKTAAALFSLAQKMGAIKPTVLETVAALSRFAIPIAIIAALYLIFDEFYNLMTGGESVIGRVLDALFGLGTAQAVAVDLAEGFGSLFDTLEDIVGLLIGPFIGAISAAVAAVTDLVGAGSAALKGDFAGALKLLQAPDARKEVSKFLAGEGGLLHDIAKPKSFASKAQQDRLQHVLDQQAGVAGDNHGLGPAAIKARDTVYVPRSHLLAHGAHGQGAPAQPPVVIHQQNHNEVNVTTASDKPQEVGDAASGGIATGQQKANNNAWNTPAVRKF